MEKFRQRKKYTRIDTEILFTVDQSATWWTLWYLQVRNVWLLHVNNSIESDFIFLFSCFRRRYDLELFDYSPEPFYEIIKAAQIKSSWELKGTGRNTWSSQFHIRQKMNMDLWRRQCIDFVAYVMYLSTFRIAIEIKRKKNI